MERLIILFIIQIGTMLQAVVPLVLFVFEILFRLMLFILRLLFDLISGIVIFIVVNAKRRPLLFSLSLLSVAVFVSSFMVARVLIGMVYERQYSSVSPTAVKTSIARETAVPPIRPTATTAISVNNTTPKTSKVISAELNVRSSPNPERENIIVVLKRGALVELTGATSYYEDSLWIKIRANGITGWVNAKYIE